MGKYDPNNTGKVNCNQLSNMLNDIAKIMGHSPPSEAMIKDYTDHYKM